MDVSVRGKGNRVNHCSCCDQGCFVGDVNKYHEGKMEDFGELLKVLGAFERKPNKPLALIWAAVSLGRISSS